MEGANGQGGQSSNGTKELVYGFWAMLTSQSEFRNAHLVTLFGRVGPEWVFTPEMFWRIYKGAHLALRFLHREVSLSWLSFLMWITCGFLFLQW